MEKIINTQGYKMIVKKEYTTALKLLQANTVFFPNSANAWDSLGEVNMLAGDKAKSIKAYQNALQLNPASANAKKMLKKLQKQ